MMRMPTAFIAGLAAALTSVPATPVQARVVQVSIRTYDWHGWWTTVVRRPGVLDIPGDVLFGTGSADLSAGAEPVLAQAAALTRSSSDAVTITGYTDNTGLSSYNELLSIRRAEAVAHRLVALGVPAARLRVRGEGEADPVVSNATASGRAQNRRVEIQVGQT